MHAVQTMVSAIAALFGVIGLGWLLAGRCSKILNDPQEDAWGFLSILVYMVCIPALTIDLFVNFQWQPSYKVFVASAILTQLIIILIIVVAMKCIGEHSMKAATVATSCLTMNAVFLGLPLVVAATGSHAAALTMLFVTVLTPLSFGASIYVLHEVAFDHQSTKKLSAIVLQKLSIDPVLLSSTIGMALMLLEIRLPAALQQSIHLLGSMALPSALLVIGSRLRIRHIGAYWNPLMITILGKLIIAPCIACAVGWVFIANRDEWIILTILNAMPSAATSALLVEKHGGDAELAANAISVTTLVGPLTLTISSILLLVR